MKGQELNVSHKIYDTTLLECGTESQGGSVGLSWGGIARCFASACFCTKFAESFGKLLVVITQESSTETLSVELLRAFLALAQSLNSFMHFVSLAVYFRTNP